jgi:AraC-like DNA-binding protein
MSAVRKKISVVHHLHACGDVGFGIVTYRPRGTYGPVRQLDFQLVVIHRGSAVVTIDGRKQTLRRGQGILLRAGVGVLFQFSRKEETTHSWCRFPPELAAAPFLFPPAAFFRPADGGPWLLDFMRHGWKLPTDIAGLEGRRRMLGLVLAAMWDFCHAFARSTGPGRPPPEPLRQAQRVMETHLAEALSLDEIAARAGVSKGYLTRLAHDHWRTTPIEHFWQLRLDESARLLGETGLGIAEIAYRTGFANPYHFSRRFRARFGRPPRAWRSALWKK